MYALIYTCVQGKSLHIENKVQLFCRFWVLKQLWTSEIVGENKQKQVDS
jgi:hypothetical protein